MAPEQRLSNMNILLVEDEVIIAMDLMESLQEAGAQVSHARNQKKALGLVDKGPFDVAVLDVNLGNGATCEPIAEALKQRGVPFVLHTGDLAKMGELVQRLEAPILPKPMRSERLIEMLLEIRTRAA